MCDHFTTLCMKGLNNWNNKYPSDTDNMLHLSPGKYDDVINLILE